MPRRRRYRPNIPFLCAVAAFVLAIAAYIGLGVLSVAISPRPLGSPAGLMLPLLARALDAASAVWFFAVGASIGSFLNVVAYRLPLGKTLGGHSACPFCCTPIAAADNIPVFAWLRLRGRCRTCHLPISIEYPLIELLVGLVFLVVYFTEFAVAGSNLPGTAIRPISSGLVWMTVTPLLATRVLLYLFALSGFIAAALIAARRAATPLSLFGWVLLVVTVGQLLRPATVVVPWWLGPASATVTRVDVLLTVGLGWLAGLMAAALTLPMLQRATSHVAWYSTLSCIGALVGWQWVATATACVLLVALLAALLVAGLAGWCGKSRWLKPLQSWQWSGVSSDPVVWTWLGLVIFRANWKSLDRLFGGLHSPTSWLLVGLCAVTASSAAWLLGWLARAESPQCPSAAQDEDFSAPAAELTDEGQDAHSNAAFAPRSSR